jgi:dihydropyrimidinase
MHHDGAGGDGAREGELGAESGGEIIAMNTLIRNGTVVTARETAKADVLLEGAVIKEVRAGIPEAAAAKVIDAAGMYVIPGGIDVHTHLDMPFGGTTSADDFETGTRAAAFGGTTSIVDFAIQARGTRMRDALDTWWKKAEGRACIDYGLHMIVTDLGTSGLEDMDDLVNEGVASFKLFMAYPNVLMVDDATIFKALSQTARNGALICMHAENGSVIDVMIARALAEGKTAPIYHALTRPPRAEAEAVHRAIALAEIAGVPVYIVHLSSEDALNQVREARDRGVPAFAETCPQYLLLSIEELERPNFEGAKYVFTPPLRPKHHLPKLWDGLKQDHLQVVSTDHCPFCFEDQKILGKDDFTKIPNGGPGIENRLQLMYHHGVNAGNLSLNRFVELTSTTPARIFGMYPKKGEIAAGSDADLVIWDPGAMYTISSRTHHMRVDYSMFEGYQVRGNARTVISRGEVIVDGGQFHGKPGRGQYLKRAARGGAWK